MRRTPLARVSAKRKADQGAYDRAMTTALLRDHYTCVAASAWPEVECGGRVEVHHVRPVGRFPELRCDVSNLATLCARHHHQTHMVNPGKARALGLLV